METYDFVVDTFFVRQVVMIDNTDWLSLPLYKASLVPKEKTLLFQRFFFWGVLRYCITMQIIAQLQHHDRKIP
ncbi:MAG: hypothetical protein RR131_08015 [Anaerovorax sp.]